ncbi:MAG TPA: RnfABCDGE type electron transport complex subunit D [Phycisphaerae bacterium]|nr:RnfABCDGE type electron transport complex subunit D [Phycisphaerae bacterium]
MRVLERLFDRLRPTFDKGRLARARPLFDAINNFFFGPKTVARVAPHVRDPLDVKRYMTMAIVGIAPAALAGIYFFGLRVVAMILVSYIVGGAVEVLFAIVRKEEINEGFLVTGLIFPLILPPALPLWMVAVGVAFGVIVGKEVFGGTGRNPFNPALVGRCFLAIGYSKAMTSAWIEPGGGWIGRATEYVGADVVSSATPLVLAKQGEFAPLANLFWGNVTGCVGETSAAVILAGGLFLVLVRVANWRTVAATLGSFALLGLLLRSLVPEHFGPVGWHMLAGGLLFGAFFMATDPVTSPITNGGKWVYGVLIGGLTLLIRSLTGYVEGVMFAILLANIAAPTIDEAVARWRVRKLGK